MRPAPESPAPLLGVEDFSRQSSLSEATVKRRFAYWFSLKIDGVRIERSRGKRGFRYVVEASVLERWHRGELPVPWESEPLALSVLPTAISPPPESQVRGQSEGLGSTTIH